MAELAIMVFDPRVLPLGYPPVCQGAIGPNFKNYVALYKHEPFRMLRAIEKSYNHYGCARTSVLCAILEHIIEIRLRAVYKSICVMIVKKIQHFPFIKYPYFTAYLRETVAHFEDRFPGAARIETVALWSRDGHARTRVHAQRIKMMRAYNTAFVLRRARFPPEINTIVRDMTRFNNRRTNTLYELKNLQHAHDAAIRELFVSYTPYTAQYYRYIIDIITPNNQWLPIDVIIHYIKLLHNPLSFAGMNTHVYVVALNFLRLGDGMSLLKYSA